jgi:hypothetical protein
VAMGHLHQPRNTFWQLFTRPAGGTAWTLATPTGVADNGGLVASDGPPAGAGPATTVTAGFEPTQYLRFSPVARSTDSGAHWAPGLLPAGLAAVPDAIAGTGSGGALALVRSAGGTVLAAGGSLATWHVLARRASLAGTAAGAACGLAGLRAVADTGSVAVVGAACTRPGAVGIFSRVGGVWEPSGLRLPGAGARLTTGVLRLQSGPSGTAALVQAGRGGRERLYALWRSGPSARWSVSAALRPAGAVVASGFSGPTGVVVVTRGPGGRERPATVAGPGGAWSVLPAAPPGTAAVVEGPAGQVDALAVAGTILTDYRLDTASGSWRRGRKLSVPIQYGSST